MMLNDVKQQISNIITNANLSIDVAYLVIKDIFKEIEELYYIELQKEKNKKEESDK